MTPRDDLMHLYSVNVATEDKTGDQIPAHFVSFAASETARHWFGQAEKKIPIGSDALPALYRPARALSDCAALLVAAVADEPQAAS